MAVEVTSEELKAVLQDSDVQALIVSKLAEKKTEGLAAALTAQYKSLGIEPDSAESASTSDAATDESSAGAEAASTEATA
ncbi:hypothetical protein P0E69_06855 [Chimaeribacter arupi]|uniref:hypothetical protein n=1 Tax=Chimaeribacter arupi TaxID=2060066 RepID=UPI000C7AE3CD|nr:hypothetical protein [Chimaeribacter arupi]PLR52410.1 hypothetical protein CYR52_07580 [Chimaeribacter arupi]WKZ93608.1 hypothetical protein P0E69_06855 [Chimaeribacter arupi]